MVHQPANSQQPHGTSASQQPTATWCISQPTANSHMGYGEDSDVLLPEDHPRVLMMGGQPFKSPPRRMQPDALVFALYHNAAIWSGDEEAQRSLDDAMVVNVNEGTVLGVGSLDNMEELGSLKDAMVVYVNEGTVLGVGSQNNMEDLVESAMSVYEAVGKVHLERVDLAGCFVMPSLDGVVHHSLEFQLDGVSHHSCLEFSFMAWSHHSLEVTYGVVPIILLEFILMAWPIILLEFQLYGMVPSFCLRSLMAWVPSFLLEFT
eukprot:gene8645-34094_t